MSEKIKHILKKIYPWAISIFVIVIIFMLPIFWYSHVGGNANERRASCTAEWEKYSDGTDINPTANYQNTSIPKIFSDDSHMLLDKVLVSGNLHYSKMENSFYLRSGALMVPLDVSDCQRLSQFKNEKDTPVAIAGTVTMNNGELIILVKGMRDVAFGWMKVLINGAFAVTVTFFTFFIWLGLGLGLKKILIKIGLAKKPDPSSDISMNTSERKAGWSLLISILSIPLWFLNPYIGLSLQIFGLYLGYPIYILQKNKIAFAGTIISVAGLVIMSLIFIHIGRFSAPLENNFYDSNLKSDIAVKPTGTETLDTDTYISAKWHFSIHPPKKWIPDDKNMESGFQMMFQGLQDGQENGSPFYPAIKVGVVAAQALNVSTAEEALAPIEKSLKDQYKDSTIIDDGNRSLAGGRSHSTYIEATYTDAKHIFTHTLLFMSVHNSILYMIGAELPEDKWKKYEKVIRDSLDTIDFPQTAVVSAINHLVTLHTTMGDISFATYDIDSGETVKNFIKLAEKGFYDGTIFEIARKGATILGGDPTGTGNGGPGYNLPNIERYSNAHGNWDWGYVRGVVAMVFDGKNVNGSQFLIMLGNAPTLAQNYTIFGQVVDGESVMDAIGNLPVDKDFRPLDPPSIESVSVKTLK